MSELTQALTKTGPASSQAIRGLESLVPRVPPDYIEFMESSNGAEGPVGEGYLALWALEEIEPLNREYAVAEFAPGLTLFGSDGGDTGYAFDARVAPPRIVEVPLVGMSLESTRERGSSLLDLLERIVEGTT